LIGIIVFLVWLTVLFLILEWLIDFCFQKVHFLVDIVQKTDLKLFQLLFGNAVTVPSVLLLTRHVNKSNTCGCHYYFVDGHYNSL